MSDTAPFQRILLLRHHRRPSDRLLAGAVDLARRCGSRLTFARALEGGDRIDDSSRAELASELRETLSPHLAGMPADYRLLSGDPAEVAERHADEYDLVVPAEGGPGSEAEQRELARLLRRSALPVWLGRRSGGVPQGILAAVDLQTSNPMKRSLNGPIVRHAASIAAHLGARLDLLSVRVPAPSSERLVRRLAGREQVMLSRRQTRDRLHGLLSAALEGLPPLASEPRLLVAHGDPDTLIAQAAESASIDLLVAGHLGRGGLAAWLIGDTAARLSRRLPCSILAVKRPHERHDKQAAGKRSRAA